MEENNVITTENNETHNEEKLFTQEDVNRIVKERLSRAKAEKAAVVENDTRAAELDAREARLSCREYLIEKGYSADFLELLDTSDVDEFKNKVEKIQSLTRTKVHTPQPRSYEGCNRDVLAEPFKKKTAHTPYKGY